MDGDKGEPKISSAAVRRCSSLPLAGRFPRKAFFVLNLPPGVRLQALSLASVGFGVQKR